MNNNSRYRMVVITILLLLIGWLILVMTVNKYADIIDNTLQPKKKEVRHE